MVDITINANAPGSYVENIGGNGTDDTVTIIVTEDFSGTVVVNSSPTDGEIENVDVQLPPGWTVTTTSFDEDDSETPSYKHATYVVRNANGDEVGTVDFTVNEINGAPCFARDTLIETPRGPVAVQDITIGDQVSTRDHGAQTVRWVGSAKLGRAALALNPHLKPIRIAAGALGHGLPLSDLLVSPQHRVLVRSQIAQRMFGAPEVLVAAKQLLSVAGIDIATDLAEVEYFHILFDAHEVVTSNGAQTESLYPGPEALRSIGKAGAEEISALFPHLRDQAPAPARILPLGRQCRQLAQRHARHDKFLQ
ncbi:Hint domain-containing protein [Paracoccus aestuariivivens]|uniref:Hemolysin-type calcium-binding region n=1 Tax=Paracoccus aestuariivivens TaxID=1820333 RepID=A0A6L6J699_9RHOB|nr:Hint domain-containing protein [Paracoccus aestuariivivens]MTH77633.1 hemolysin-type calcium-binding region [Paracoccus aestuariivivens]